MSEHPNAAVIRSASEAIGKAVTGSWRRRVPAKTGAAGLVRAVTGRRCWRQVCLPVRRPAR